MKRWNIFARELEDILGSRNLRLGHLDDRAGIHREKVRRLRQSLVRPKSFPVLNPDEMDAIEETFQLKTYEVLHLRAAVLAAAIEEQLMERIDAESALLVAEQILPMLSKALRDNYNRIPAFGSIREEQGDPKEVTDLDQALEGALLAIDRATKFFYQGSTTADHTQMYMQQAQAQFVTALALLMHAPDEMKVRDEWQVWYNEALKGVSKTTNNLEPQSRPGSSDATPSLP